MSLAALTLSSPLTVSTTTKQKPRPPHNPKPKITCSSLTTQSQSAKQHLLNLISDQERGLKTQNDTNKRDSIIKAIDAMAVLGRNTVTTGDSLSATWRLLWTTEKEQLFIIEKAYLFGTQAGDVLQVVDVDNKTLNNVITFPPDGVFFVRSSIEIASSQRVYECGSQGEKLGVPIASIWAGLELWVPSLAFDNKVHSSLMPFLKLQFGKNMFNTDSEYFLVFDGNFLWIRFPVLFEKAENCFSDCKILYRFETVYLDDEIRVVKDIRDDYLVVERAPYNWKE
ncbi:hypothetical protein Gotri_021050 [Gossypium trilobum]|uniref:Plastid lipid-associated protein/fibrillin conserved domain-containing protein n=1 Tax=Gossypium trilobum TaxID=34281 RepID=A0A7J9DB79_9ROSI|nr:hypothetical protein [Gossypium trilobum]